jgi:signal peptide peptidase SppA
MNNLSLYLANMVLNQPWLIEQHAFQTIHDIAMARIKAEKYTREGEGECGEKVEFDGMEIEDGVAKIPISGVLVSNPEFKVRGLVDMDDIAREIEDAEVNDAVERIEFHMDTPGGMVRGTPELADMIFRVEKPTKAIVKGTCASAGYWLAAATDEIVASRTCDIGSIGVLITIPDYSGYYEQMGVKVNVVASGDLKAMGVPGTSLTESQIEHLRDRVNSIFGMFKDHVESMRGELDPEVFRGQTFMAEKAMEYGLIDSVIS